MRYFQQCPHCGRAAWEYKKKPESGDAITVESVIHADNPKAGEKLACQLCKKNIGPYALTENQILEVVGMENGVQKVPKIYRPWGKKAGWMFRTLKVEGVEKLKVMFYCPSCKELKDIKNHAVDGEGNVSPEVMCGCGGYHEEVKLNRWPLHYRKQGAVEFVEIPKSI